jgi:hypothetical protein
MKCSPLVALGVAAASCSWQYHNFFSFLCNNTTFSTLLHLHWSWGGGFFTWCLCGHIIFVSRSLFTLVVLVGTAASCSWQYHSFCPYLWNSTTFSTLFQRHWSWSRCFCSWCFCGHFHIFSYYTSSSSWYLSVGRKLYLDFRLYDFLLRRIFGEPLVLYFLQQQVNRCLRFLEHCALAHGDAIFGHTVCIAHCCNCSKRFLIF